MDSRSLAVAETILGLAAGAPPLAPTADGRTATRELLHGLPANGPRSERGR